MNVPYARFSADSLTLPSWDAPRIDEAMITPGPDRDEVTLILTGTLTSDSAFRHEFRLLPATGPARPEYALFHFEWNRADAIFMVTRPYRFQTRIPTAVARKGVRIVGANRTFTLDFPAADTGQKS
ncbi:MAG: hypothetical protein CML68_22345 [Rhodobacteraceae bacterium]|nr:hypothetical protein [Paracoccaceae bacterium]